MRINHNISALNTYRQLTVNSTNTTKTLEKLSSGLRINRAGDDAAGLAISEKMRGQIRGLNQAQRNAQDGISMIQTAEGALSEVHSILQRMKELATQAANGTNTDADRAEIQKEINQLTSEVNRIGNNTEFNTKKVLNGGGSISAVSVTATTPPDPEGGATGTLSAIAGTPGAAASPAIPGEAAVWDTGAITALADDSSGTFIFNGVTVTVNTADAAVGAVSDYDAKTASITIENGADADTTAQAILDALEHYQTTANGGSNELTDFTFGGDGSGLTITGTAADGAANNGLQITGTIGIAHANAAQLTTPGVDEAPGTPGTAASWDTGALAALADDSSGTFSFNGVTVTVTTGAVTGAASDYSAKTATIGIGNGADADATAQAILDALEHYQTTANGGSNELSDFTFGGDGSGLTITGTAADGAANNGLEISWNIAAASTGTAGAGTLGADEIPGTAAAWDTGAVTALGADESGTFVFNGITVTVNTADAAVGAASDYSAKTASITIENAGVDANATAQAILDALEHYQTTANGGSNELTDFTFGGDGSGLTITGTAADGDDNNGLEITVGGDLNVTNTGAASLAIPGVDEVPGTAAAWDTGALAALADDSSGTFSFNGVTVTVTTGAVTGAASDYSAKTATIGIENGADADATAQAILDALEHYQTTANGGSNELTDFTFGGDGSGLTITGTAADGAANNGLEISWNIAAASTGTAGAGTLGADEIPGVPGTAAAWNTGAVTALDDDSSATFSFNGVTVTVNTADAAVGAASDYSAKTASITIENGADADATAQAILDALEHYQTTANGGSNELSDFTFGGDGSGLAITGSVTDGAANNGLQITGTIGIAHANAAQLTTPGVDETPATPGTQGTTTFTISTALGAGDRFDVAGQTITVYETDEELAAAADDFGISLESAATAEEQAAAIRAMTFADLETGGADATVTLSQTVNGIGDVTDAGEVVGPGIPGVYTFGMETAIAAGGSYIIDGQEIVVVDDANAADYTDEIAAGTVMLAGADAAAQRENLAAAINAHAELSVTYAAAVSGTDITLTQQTFSESDPAPVVSTTLQAGATGIFSISLQIGANQGQNFAMSIDDMRAQKLGISGTTGGANATGYSGNVQEASFSVGTDNRLTDTSTGMIAEYALDVSDTAKASAAISVIDEAITKVSAERSKLGAYQNRLEHTINNLDTSAENLTAAESRIRDVDMAKELMEFTKNNILTQAAQAMLAQANQQPQGVLQLLK